MKKIIITVFGFGLVIIGIPLLVLPGPGILVILAGLAILGREYHWAKRLMQPLKDRFGKKKGPENSKT